MGDQIVMLMDGSNTILKTMVCKDRSYDEIVNEVRRRWAGTLHPAIKLIIGTVVSVDDCTATFSRNGTMLNLPYGTYVVKE